MVVRFQAPGTFIVRWCTRESKRGLEVTGTLLRHDELKPSRYAKAKDVLGTPVVLIVTLTAVCDKPLQ